MDLHATTNIASTRPRVSNKTKFCKIIDYNYYQDQYMALGWAYSKRWTSENQWMVVDPKAYSKADGATKVILLKIIHKETEFPRQVVQQKQSTPSSDKWIDNRRGR